jgi:aromatic ring-opening dioxygenase LigB subunit
MILIGLKLSILGAFLMPHPAILVPEVGKGREEQFSNLACLKRCRKNKALAPDPIVLVSPHAQAYAEFCDTEGISLKRIVSFWCG